MQRRSAENPLTELLTTGAGRCQLNGSHPDMTTIHGARAGMGATQQAAARARIRPPFLPALSLHDLSETRASGPKCRLRRVFGLAVGADPDAAIPARPQPLTTQGRSISRAWTYYAIVALHGPVSPTFPSSRRWPFRFRPANLPERNGSPPPSSRSEPATRGRG